MWGPYAPDRTYASAGRADDIESDKAIAILAHVSFFIFAPFLALIFRQSTGRRNQFVRHHATEALNFQLTFLIPWLGVGVTTLLLAAQSSDPDGTTTGWIALPILCMFALYALAAVWSVRGAVRANQSTWWRYPISIRFVRGAQPVD